MMLRVQRFKSLSGYVCVNLRRRDIRMPEQHLHHPQIRAMIEQMRGKRMAQYMGGQRRMNTR
jgi:hypothetical protein